MEDSKGNRTVGLDGLSSIAFQPEEFKELVMNIISPPRRRILNILKDNPEGLTIKGLIRKLKDEEDTDYSLKDIEKIIGPPLNNLEGLGAVEMDESGYRLNVKTLEDLKEKNTAFNSTEKRIVEVLKVTRDDIKVKSEKLTPSKEVMARDDFLEKYQKLLEREAMKDYRAPAVRKNLRKLTDKGIVKKGYSENYKKYYLNKEAFFDNLKTFDIFISSYINDVRRGLYDSSDKIDGKIVLLSGSFRGKEHELKCENVKIGRIDPKAPYAHDSCDLVFPGDQSYRFISRISKPHAEIRHTEGQYLLVHAPNKNVVNHTSLNGVKLKECVEHPLRRGDIITIADVEIRFL